jgi:hypothetical protein
LLLTDKDSWQTGDSGPSWTISVQQGLCKANIK